jgi:hypothetical protein
MIFYRYESGNVQNIGELYTSELIKRTFKLKKETPKGYWIIQHGHPATLHSKPRWVSKTAKKRYAYPTEKEALANCIARTKRRMKFLKRDLAIANSILHQAEKMG